MSWNDPDIEPEEWDDFLAAAGPSLGIEPPWLEWKATGEMPLVLWPLLSRAMRFHPVGSPLVPISMEAQFQLDFGAMIGLLTATGKDPERMRAILLPTAHAIARRWREIVPVRTGMYQDTITVVDNETLGDKGFVDIVTYARNPRDGYPYPVALEFGTDRIEAGHYAQRAFDETEEEAEYLLAKAFEDDIKRSLSH